MYTRVSYAYSNPPDILLLAVMLKCMMIMLHRRMLSRPTLAVLMMLVMALALCRGQTAGIYDFPIHLHFLLFFTFRIFRKPKRNARGVIAIELPLELL